MRLESRSHTAMMRAESYCQTPGISWTREIRPTPIRPDMPVLVAAKGERMLRLTARHADAWQTAWFGRPDDRYRQRHAELLAACAAEGRDPETLQVTVGVEVDGMTQGGTALPLEIGPIAEAFGEWREIGADHLQLAVLPSTAAAFHIVLEAIRASRT
jgi:hypothetical protein